MKAKRNRKYALFQLLRIACNYINICEAKYRFAGYRFRCWLRLTTHDTPMMNKMISRNPPPAPNPTARPTDTKYKQGIDTVQDVYIYS